MFIHEYVLFDLKVSFMREDFYLFILHTGEWLLAGLWSCCGLYATGVAALCCIIKSHIHPSSFSFFLPVSLYQSRSRTGTSMNRGHRGEKVEVFVCSRDSLSHWLAFSHVQAWKKNWNRKNYIMNDLERVNTDGFSLTSSQSHRVS